MALAANGQDIHFTQFVQAPLSINPALAGNIVDGMFRGSIHYKNQWASMGHAFNTMAASFDMPFSLNKRKATYFGAGVFIYTDKAGDAGLGTTQASLCGSGTVPLSPYLKVSAGLNFAFNQQHVNIASLNFANQYTGSGFDPNMQSNETGSPSYIFFDAGAGFNMSYSNAKGNISHDDVFRINAGVSGYHLNMPRQSFYSAGGDRLHIKLIGHVDARIDIRHTKFSVVPSVLYMMQGPNMEIDGGALCRYRMKTATKITGNSNETAISLGCHYRYNDALMPEAYFEVANFALGISYDLNISSYKEISHMNGGFELSIKYIKLLDSLFEKRI